MKHRGARPTCCRHRMMMDDREALARLLAAIRDLDATALASVSAQEEKLQTHHQLLAIRRLPSWPEDWTPSASVGAQLPEQEGGFRRPAD